MKTFEDDEFKMQFHRYLKYYLGPQCVNDMKPIDVFTSDRSKLCKDNLLRCIVDRKGAKFEHYMVQLDDNFIGKEFLQVSYALGDAFKAPNSEPE